jgi:hypothetical protein
MTENKDSVHIQRIGNEALGSLEPICGPLLVAGAEQ